LGMGDKEEWKRLDSSEVKHYTIKS
jgi:hypothetical protein